MIMAMFVIVCMFLLVAWLAFVEIRIRGIVKSLNRSFESIESAIRRMDAMTIHMDSMAKKMDDMAVSMTDIFERLSAMEKTPSQFESKYSEETKRSCIEYYKSNKESLSLRQAARDMNIPYTTFNVWVRRAEK